MDKETIDRIWLLVTNKLANEANEDELIELNNLSEQNPDLELAVKTLSDYWNDNKDCDTLTNSGALFNKIKAKLN